MMRTSQRGAVSIFIVIFTALLVTVVATGFVRIMLQAQEQASNNDLSQSAYDSALAGVEDAKRALVRLKECQRSGGGSADCVSLENALANDGEECDVLDRDKAGLVEFDNGEVAVESTGTLNQAYTCVKIDVATESVTGTLSTDDTVVIPLDSLGSDDDIQAVRISWFQEADLPSLTSPVTFTTPFNLPADTDVAWPRTTPPILRAQLIQFTRGTIVLDDFTGQSARTKFLYPTLVPDASISFGSDTRRSGGAASRNDPSAASCSPDFASATSTYLCTATVTLPGQANREAYLQLAAIYNGTRYKVELCGDATCSGASILDFDGVQPRVDATGRASDLFRRVEARVSINESGSPVTFPNAALTLEKSLCKDFFVTDNADDYSNDTDGVECEPSL
jgi:Tfp pilus assembly protein PilX